VNGGARAPLVAVCGGAAATGEEAAAAEVVGRLLAERGAVVVCGGLGGVMEAVCRGTAAAGGLSVGLLPGDDPAAANAHVGLALATGLGELRNGLIARVCRGMIAIGGGYGTLSEVALMLRLGRPVCALGSWRLVPPQDGDDDPAFHRADDPRGAVDWLLDRI
jgi:uncharacterized protein (TIGR00725 family)